KPRDAKSRKASSKSAGDLVCTSAVSAPSLALMSSSPWYAAAFHPASLTGPGVSSATLNAVDSGFVSVEGCRVQAPRRLICSSRRRTKLLNFRTGLLSEVHGAVGNTGLAKGLLALEAFV